MFTTQTRIQPPLGSKNMSISDRAKGEGQRQFWPGPLAWYFAQRALPVLKYVLTTSGYVVLP